MHKTHHAGDATQRGKLIRRNEFDHWQMLQGGLQILAEREDIATGGPQIFHGHHELIFGFTETEHEPGFRVDILAAFGFNLFQHA